MKPLLEADPDSALLGIQRSRPATCKCGQAFTRQAYEIRDVECWLPLSCPRYERATLRTLAPKNG